MDENDAFKMTIQTYDQVAPQYVERSRRSDVQAVRPEFVQFTNYLLPGARVLDLGCGPGFHTVKFRESGYPTIGIDLSTGMLNEAKNIAGAGLIQADMRRVPLSTACLDGVWMCASLLHLPRSESPFALSEAHRVLRAGGVLHVSVKMGQGETIQQNLGSRFFTFYQTDELINLVEQVGFQVIEHHLEVEPQVTWIGLVARK